MTKQAFWQVLDIERSAIILKAIAWSHSFNAFIDFFMKNVFEEAYTVDVVVTVCNDDDIKICVYIVMCL
jgi:hypothetical protein